MRRYLFRYTLPNNWENEISNTRQYLGERLNPDNIYGEYTEVKGVGSVSYFARYIYTGQTYELQIEFSIDKFYK